MSHAKILASFSATMIGDLGGLGRLEQGRVDGGGGGANVRLHGIVDHLRGEAGIFAHHIEGLGLADLAREFLDVPSACVSLMASPGFQEIQALADARQDGGSRRDRPCRAPCARKMASRVSLRPTTTWTVEAATLACCAPKPL